MYKIGIKPLTVNQAHRTFRGRILKSKPYKQYEKDLLILLPKIKVGSDKLSLTLEVGFSNKAMDIDNILKPFIDILQKAYEFNDKMIYKLSVEKKDVKKGEEYIKFKIL